MKRSKPRVVGDLLVQALPDLGDRLLVERLRRSWRDVVGADIARRSEPQGLVNGCLTVVVDNSPWLQELTLRADELTARLHERHAGVRAVRFVLGTPMRETVAAPPRAPRSRPLTPPEARDIEEAVAVIPDPAVQASARRLLTRARQQDAPAVTR